MSWLFEFPLTNNFSFFYCRIVRIHKSSNSFLSYHPTYLVFKCKYLSGVNLRKMLVPSVLKLIVIATSIQFGPNLSKPFCCCLSSQPFLPHRKCSYMT
jgi:hypothetical protein